MVVLLDTNMLLRIHEAGHVQHQVAVQSTLILTQRGEGLSIVPQCLYEFWTVATRPKNVNGLGLSTAEAASELRKIKGVYKLFVDKADILPAWEILVATHQCSGKAAYDARLVAAMQVHSINAILTFNTGDFQRYPGIIVLDPMSVISTSAPPLPSTPKATP